jgi:phage gp36-like protein
MYITVEEFEKALSPTLRRVLSSENDGLQNDTVIEETIKQASSMIDSYVGYRYTIPLTYVGEQVKSVCSDIAIYRLFNRRNAVTDEIIGNYKLAIQFLRDVSQDKALIEGASLKGSDYDTETINNVYAKSCSDEAKFDEQNLSGWKML